MFDYWFETHIRPKLEPFGFYSVDSFFKRQLERQCRRDGGRMNVFASFSLADCELELNTARWLLDRGVTTS